MLVMTPLIDEPLATRLVRELLDAAHAVDPQVTRAVPKL